MNWKKSLILFLILLFPAVVSAMIRRRGGIQDVSATLPRNGSYPLRDVSQIRYAVIHHTATSQAATPTEIARIHTEKGWPGIGYHYLIYPDGRILQTQAENVKSNHVAGNNTAALGIAFVGNYQQQQPAAAMYQSAKALIKRLSEKYTGIIVKRHGDFVNTQCPGSIQISKIIS